MVWRNFFRKTPETGGAEREMASPVPPRLAQAIERRANGGERPAIVDPAQRKLAGLRRQRHAILFDIEQGELAASPDNPWTNRIALLADAMTTVTDDLATAGAIAPGPFHPLPATPISIDSVDAGETAAVAFTIGNTRFAYSDDPDWAERGHQVVQTELVRRSGDAGELIPIDTPRDLRDALREHLDGSLFVFASDLRDRLLDGDPVPASPTLADLAAPCPVCGGWTDWRGTCQACARRTATLAALKREETRLLDERNRESDERRRLVEGLPLARKRLRDIEADLARLGDTFD